MKEFANTEVADVFGAYPAKLRKRLMFLREQIFEVASTTEGVGDLEETLKWGEPAYVTSRSKSGSTIRIGRRKDHEGHYAIYFHCQTTLVDTFRTLFPTQFKFEGNRAIVFDEADEVPVRELRCCIALALTYHRNKTTKERSTDLGRRSMTGRSRRLRARGGRRS